MKVITVLNQKGGAGKTTISTGIAAALTNMNKRALLIDADFTQESAMTWAKFNEGKYFDVVVIESSQIKTFIERNTENYDYIIIDCPPRANDETARFVTVSHLVLIPIQPSPYDIWACNDLIDVIQQRKELTRGIAGLPADGLPHAAFVMSIATKGTRLVGETADALSDTGFRILDNMTTRYETYKRAAMTGHTIFDSPEPNEAAQDQIIGITREVLEILYDEA